MVRFLYLFKTASLTKLRFVGCLLIIFVCLAQPCLALPQVIASVDQPEVGINETITLMVSITELDVQGLDFPRDTNDYSVIATSSSSNFSFINGKSTSSKTFKFLIKAKHPGQIVLPAASVSSAGDIYSTQPITVLVHASPAPNSPGMPSNSAAPGLPRAMNTHPQNKVFARISVGRSNPYINEQIPLSLKIYHKGNLRSLNIPPLKLDNFISEKSDKAKEYQETDGIDEYLVYEIDFMLFPVKAGLLTIPSNKIKAIVLEDNNNLSMGNFDPFRLMNPFMVEREIELETNELQVNVKSLPKGAPKGFSGYVGELAVNHSLKQSSVKAGEALNIQTKLYGSGDLSSIDTNLVGESQLYSVFKDKQSSREEVNNSIKYFELVTNTAIIPNKSTGKLSIETKPIISFNPKTGKYESHGGQKFEIEVLPNDDKDTDEEPDVKANVGKETKPKKIEIKEIFVIPDEEIKNYQPFPLNARLLAILLLILNAIALLVKAFKLLVKSEQLNRTTNSGLVKACLKNVRQSEDIAEISKLLKELRNNLEPAIEKSPELKHKLDDYFRESDKANYAMQSTNADPEQKLEYFKSNAVSIVKELEKLG